jgi:hypothetical protein
MKALFSILILLGTSSVALATPMLRDQRSDYDRYDNDRRDGNDRDQRFHWRNRPVVLAQNVSLMRRWNHDHRPTLIDIDSRAGRFDRLRLNHDSGRMYVESVTLRFANGGTRTFTVNQLLSQRSPSITLDLDGRAVTAMYVNANTARGRATFDVIGLRR